MGLKNIAADVAVELGTQTSVVTERAFLVARINEAAKEIYESRDLPGSLREGVFQLDPSTQVVSLPWYAGKIRAVRQYDTRAKLPIHDQRPRYKHDGWKENLLAWRQKGRFPIAREILNAALLTLTIPQAESADFSVVIVGATESSNHLVETVTFTAGDTTKTTVNGFRDILSIQNAALHTYDVTVTDVDGNTMAVLLNNKYSTDYLWVQVLDYAAVGALQNPYPVEVLYKQTLLPMQDDYDEFPCPGCDKVITWKTLEYLLAGADVTRAGIAQKNVASILSQIERDAISGQDMEVDFAPNPLVGLHSRGGQPGVANGVTYWPGSYPAP